MTEALQAVLAAANKWTIIKDSTVADFVFTKMKLFVALMQKKDWNAKEYILQAFGNVLANLEKTLASINDKTM